MSLASGVYAIKNNPTNTFLTVGQTRFQTEDAPIIGLPGPPDVYGWWVVNNTQGNNFQIPWVEFGILQPLIAPGGLIYSHAQPINLAAHLGAAGLVDWTIEPAQNGLFTINTSNVFLTMWNEGVDTYSPITAEPPSNSSNQLWELIRR